MKSLLIGVALLAASRISGVSSLAPPGPVTSAWWTSWHASDFPISKLSWSKYNRVVYAFAETAPDVNTLDLGDPGGLMQFGFLTSKGDAAPDIYYRYDYCTQTPYVYNATSEVMVAFDNADSFTAKGKYIKSAGLRGFAMWEAGGDSDDILLDAVRSAAGYL
ncbi:hypothetical protein OE88DRAFT_1253228 [Heliocybe sulcata]|uniref:GH18 domain-containing protein n=1 Tax=Heliocybe sulcata TaxID=5364 RepID=A0A5C3N822_9AGAM|nr:hypothetical protein OE88DRAFT_1253228 [Heliocybe sulcata]